MFDFEKIVVHYPNDFSLRLVYKKDEESEERNAIFQAGQDYSPEWPVKIFEERKLLAMLFEAALDVNPYQPFSSAANFRRWNHDKGDTESVSSWRYGLALHTGLLLLLADDFEEAMNTAAKEL